VTLVEASLPVLAGLVGAVVGSFLNVVIWRLPRGESLSRPRSRCPRCGAPIAWYDNVPILSWVFLRGRCRRCRAPISVRYPAVEALTALLFVLAQRRWPDDLATASIAAVALAAFVAISFIDWDHKMIPDKITKPGMALAVALAVVGTLHPRDWLPGVRGPMNAWLHSIAGLLAGLALILAIRFLGRVAFRKEAMGLGDAKLLAFVGALVGPIGAVYALILACVGGAVIGLALFAVGKRRPIACTGTVEVGPAGRGAAETLTGVKFGRDASVFVPVPAVSEVGAPVRLRLRLPAAKVLEEEDAAVEWKGRLAAVEDVRGRRVGRVALDPLSDAESERLHTFAHSYRYVPFGPFLSLGGAAALLYGDRVHWLFTEGYPQWARGVFGGSFLL
jgi:leader peptidase (prepilin peptidase)/N-methyltransferase